MTLVEVVSAEWSSQEPDHSALRRAWGAKLEKGPESLAGEERRETGGSGRQPSVGFRGVSPEYVEMLWGRNRGKRRRWRSRKKF